MNALVTPCDRPESVEIARLEEFTLHRIAFDVYELRGPGAHFPRAWVVAHLPVGDWYSEWSGTDTLVVTFTR